MSYTPKAGELDAKVVAYFARHRGEELSAADIALKFDCPANLVEPSLSTAITSRTLERYRGAARGWTYRAGPRIGDVSTEAVKQAAAAKGKPAPTIVTLQDPRNGKTVQAVKREDLAAAGVKLSEPRTAKSGGSNTDHAAERQARDAKTAALTAANVALLHRVRAATAAQPPGLLELRLIVECLLESVLFTDDTPVLAALYNVEHERQIEQLVPTLDAQGLTRLAIDCALIGGITSTYWESTKPERLLQMAEAHGVPLVASEVADEPSTPSPAAPAAKKAAKNSKAKGALANMLEAAGV